MKSYYIVTRKQPLNAYPEFIGLFTSEETLQRGILAFYEATDETKVSPTETLKSLFGASWRDSVAKLPLDTFIRLTESLSQNNNNSCYHWDGKSTSNDGLQLWKVRPDELKANEYNKICG